MKAVDSAAVEGTMEMAVAKDGVTIPIVAHMISGNYFSFLGVRVFDGRTLTEADAGSVSNGVPVVISYRFWRRYYGGAKLSGSETLQLKSVPFAVVGVMPQQFYGTTLDDSPDI